MAKSKSMTGKEGGRKLAADHGRTKSKSGGEPKKKTETSGEGRLGSSKKRKS